MRPAAVLVLAALILSGAGQAGTARRTGGAGVTVVLPAGWHAWNAPRNLDPAVTDPLTRVVAVSAPFHFAGHGCQIAAYAFPPTAVAVVVVEWTRLWHDARWSPRPASFSAGTLRVRPPPAIECFDGSGGSAQFVEHGRHLGAYLLAGRRANAAAIAQARTVLDSLRALPR